MRKFLTMAASALAITTLLAACGAQDAGQTSEAKSAANEVAIADIKPVKSAALSEVIPSDRNVIPHAQLPTNVIPTSYDIELWIDPSEDSMRGAVLIDVDIQSASDHIWIHGKAMESTQAFIEYPDDTRTELEFVEIPVADAPSGLMRLDGEVKAGKATLHLTYNTPYNTSLNSAYKVERGDDDYIVTQFEPLGAREAFPGFDEPKYKVPFDLKINAPSSNKVFANTPVVEESDIDSPLGDDAPWTSYKFATTRPLPTYLIAFAVGPYDLVDYGDIPPNEIRKRPLALRGIAARGEGKNLDYALENTAGILTALEAYFGQEYPYEKLDLLAAPEYAFGAMENPGLIVYREYLLLLSEDAPLSQKRSHASVHSHELAHQWFGNLVTPVWWEDIWLNEAFATWMGNKGIDMWKPEGNFDRNSLRASLGAMSIDTLSTTRSVREPLTRSENVMEQFDGITYRKGGGVLSMFESFVGVEAFRDGVRLHMARYKDDVATADDFFQSIADGSKNPDVVSAMKSFVDQPGVPIISISSDNGALNITQQRYAPLGSKTQQGQTWEIPITMRMGYADDPETFKYLLKDSSMALADMFRARQPDWIMPNADGAGYYRFSLDSAGWDALLSNIDKLNTKEVLAVQDSLNAAFNAGKVEAAVYLKGMEIFAKHPEYDVASGAGGALGLFEEFLDESHDDALAKLTQDMYADRFAKIYGTDTVEGNLLAPTLAARLMRYGQDEALEAKFAAMGRQYLGLDGDVDTTTTPKNMLLRALQATMRADGDAAYGPLLQMVSKGSSFEKGAAISALGSTTDKTIAKKLREFALTGTDDMTGRQAVSLISVLMGNREHEDDTWGWFTINFDQFVKTRVPDVRKPGMPGMRGGCELSRRDMIEKFFTSKADIIPGYERNLAQTLESIELCSALKDAVVEDLSQALKAR